MVHPTEFGVFLKEKRVESKLTQDELAASIGKTGQYICNIEIRKRCADPCSDVYQRADSQNHQNGQ